MIDDIVDRALAHHDPNGEDLETVQRSDGIFVISDGDNGIGCANPVDLEAMR